MAASTIFWLVFAGTLLSVATYCLFNPRKNRIRQVGQQRDHQARLDRFRLARISKLAISPLPAPAAWYAIPFRLIIGLGFLQHGYAKLARGLEDFINILHAIGIPSAFLLGWATILVEIIGGLLIVIGAFVPLVAIPLVIVLLVAIFTVHLPNGFSSIKLQAFDAAGAHFGQPGIETDLLYLAGLVALCFGGAGPISVDGRLGAFGSAKR